MPGLVRKILVFATIDGLVLQSQAQRVQTPSAKIAYEENTIEPYLDNGEEPERQRKSFEAFGIVGILTLAGSKSFLITITRRQQVAQIQGNAIYVVSEVALTPLGSRAEAEASIASTSASLQKKFIDVDGVADSDSEEESSVSAARSKDDVDDVVPPTPQRPTSSRSEHKRTSSVAEDVISKRPFGRFARNFFSKKGWNVDQRRNLGMSANDDVVATPENEPVDGLEPAAPAGAVGTEEQNTGDVARALLPKLLRTTQILFGTSRSFFFSYDYDITRNFAERRPNSSDLPLYTQVDPLFFWNRNVIQPFIDAGQSSFVLPLMQGFVGQRSFEMDTDPPNRIGIPGSASSAMEMKDFSAGIPQEESVSPDLSETPKNRRSKEGSRTEKDFLLTLISRRSVKRAGLRYLRRGVDEDGNTANGVETEQILSSPDWSPSSKAYSFLQLRGSIPIFFSQTPYSFKPVPQIQHSAETNFKAFKKHFDDISTRYGKIQVANLVEKGGNEAIVGNAYELNMKRLNEERSSTGNSVGFEWFDFHAMCRGMKFENVAILIDKLGDQLDNFGQTISVNGITTTRQSGVLRTNCMDCLDRTNVVQSACGRRALERQLKLEGVDMSLQVDQSVSFFNTLWADNGDFVSKQYASTAAMKSDYTRTGKRNLQGALNDMGFSIQRFYSGIVNDFFSQAAIDFLLGNVTSQVFEDFETNLMSGDPGISMQKMRQQAIDVSQKIVIADPLEEFVGGWTLLTPNSPNTIKSMPFEEAVLLLTDTALYATRFDFNTEKVLSFERVDLTHVVNIKYGTYITSTLSASQADETKNVGFVITYRAGDDDITRVNTRSMDTSAPAREEPPAKDPFLLPPASQATAALTQFIAGIKQPEPPTNRVLAWKALPSRSAVSESSEDAPRLSEIESVKAICTQIERMVHHWQQVEAGTERESILEAGEIISLAAARQSTGIFEQLGHSLKKLVWA